VYVIKIGSNGKIDRLNLKAQSSVGGQRLHLDIWYGLQ